MQLQDLFVCLFVTTPYPEEAVRGLLWSETALHTRRELIPQASGVVIIVVTCFLSKEEDIYWEKTVHQNKQYNALNILQITLSVLH